MNATGWSDELGFAAFVIGTFLAAFFLLLAAGWVVRGLGRSALRSMRMVRYRRRLPVLTTSTGLPMPWREPRYGLPRALAEPGHTAARERVAALLEPISGADQS